jgi:hypothetical protein
MQSHAIQGVWWSSISGIKSTYQSDEERRDHCGRPPQFGFLKIHSPNQAKATQREPDHPET